MIEEDGPFVLLDDARANGATAARLYRAPAETIVAETVDAVRPALERLRGRDGRHAAGFLAYEAGHAFEPRLGPPPSAATPLLWFGRFDRCETIAAGDVPALLPDPDGAWLGRPAPAIDRAAYDAAVARTLDWIAAGDIYQANLSFRAAVPVAGHPLALYARLRAAGGAGWGGIVFTGRHWLLSLSPESFFTLAGDRITARPMKGTAPRGQDRETDAARAAGLAASAKDRAENLMIVDLIRNDLSRVAMPGSVAAPALFAVETYPTLHQMTSTVTAALAPGRDAVDVLAALFPCGSITGAPKIRAMEIIRDLERAPRGPYAGAIGRIDADGDAAFNVAIRTLVLADGATTATLGLGSAIVADSRAAGEWAEAETKGGFVTAASPRLDLIETMRFDALEGLVDLERHLGRLKASAAALGLACDRHAIRNHLHAATFRYRDDRRVRLRLSPSGQVAIEVTPLPAMVATPVTIAVAPLPVPPQDIRLRHKTGDRRFYDQARRASGRFEILFTDPDGFLTEGSFTSLFVERDGRLLTPPLGRGLLPGVLRDRLIADGRAVEQDLRREDLARGFLVGNALRGLIPAKLG